MYSDRPAGGASLVFHLLLYLSFFWSLVWWVTTIVLLLIKWSKFPFINGALIIEIISSILVFIVNFLGVTFAKGGNLLEEVRTIAMSLAFLIIALGGAIYFMWFQSYVMRLDLIVSAVFLGINGFTLFGGIWAIYKASLPALAPSYLFEKNSKGNESKKWK